MPGQGVKGAVGIDQHAGGAPGLGQHGHGGVVGGLGGVNAQADLVQGHGYGQLQVAAQYVGGLRLPGITQVVAQHGVGKQPFFNAAVPPAGIDG